MSLIKGKLIDLYMYFNISLKINRCKKKKLILYAMFLFSTWVFGVYSIVGEHMWGPCQERLYSV